VASNRLEDQEVAVHALRLLQSCPVYVNTLMLQRVLAAQSGSARSRSPCVTPARPNSRVARASSVTSSASGQERRAWQSVGRSRSFALNDATRVVVGHSRKPTLEGRSQRSIERPSAGLQEKMRTAPGPLHLLLFGEPFAHHGVDRRLHES
jgi:hypothetical protein